MPEEVVPGIEEEEEGTAEGARPTGLLGKFKGKLVKILGIAVGIIVLLIVTVVVSQWVVKNYLKETPIKELGEKSLIPPPPPYSTMDLGEFTVNIRSTKDTDPHFVRARISLAYEGGKMSRQLESEISKRKAQFQDLINMIISSKTKEYLETIEGKRNLKIEIRERINSILQSGKIKDVYFREFTVM